MLIRIEIFDDAVLRATVFRVSTATAAQTFTAQAKAIHAFRAMARRRLEIPSLKRAA